MSLSNRISLVCKQRDWFRANVNNLSYKTLNQKYYGSLSSISKFIDTQKTFRKLFSMCKGKDDEYKEYEEYEEYEYGDEYKNE